MVPKKRGRQREDEKPHRQDAQHDAKRTREEHRLESRRQASSFLVLLEKRPPPEHAEQEERDHEHDRRGGEEQGLGNREVTDASDPVGEGRHGWTVRSAI